MFQLDYKSGVSICDQIVSSVIRLKGMGVLPAGSQLPSVRALALQLSVNPNTIQKAYTILESKGILCSVKGKGSFLSDDVAAEEAVRQKAQENFLQAIRSARELGLTDEELIHLIKGVE